MPQGLGFEVQGLSVWGVGCEGSVAHVAARERLATCRVRQGQKMLKGHLPRVISTHASTPQVKPHSSTKVKGALYQIQGYRKTLVRCTRVLGLLGQVSL